MASCLARARFAREGQVTGSLVHPRSVRVRSAGDPPDLAYELVEGRPLSRAFEGVDLRARVAWLRDEARAARLLERAVAQDAAFEGPSWPPSCSTVAARREARARRRDGLERARRAAPRAHEQEATLRCYTLLISGRVQTAPGSADASGVGRPFRQHARSARAESTRPAPHERQRAPLGARVEARVGAHHVGELAGPRSRDFTPRGRS